MTVSGIVSSNLFDVNRVIDAAYRRLRIPAQRITPEMQQIAIDNLNLLLSASGSRGFQLWTVDTALLPMTQGDPAAQTPGGTIDVLYVAVLTNGYERGVTRVNQDTYDAQPIKLTQGLPTMYWLDRQRDVPVIRLWPAPDAATSAFSQLSIRRKRHLMDVTSLTQTLDVPQRWQEAIVAQLAWRLADETPDADPNIADRLKARADEAYRAAQVEERDSSPMRLMPRIGGYNR